MADNITYKSILELFKCMDCSTCSPIWLWRNRASKLFLNRILIDLLGLQRAACKGGFDLRQLRMLKAEVAVPRTFSLL